MKISKLNPPQISYIWGGEKLSTKFGKPAGETIGESWELSFDKANPTYIATGENAGSKLCDVATKADIGKNSDGMEFFPLLIKLIDAREDLSVQVHPSDSYAQERENQYGKTEMWYVLDAEKDGKICYGLKESIEREELMELMQSGKIMEKLNFVEAKKGDIFFVESGTIHAIGKGTTIYEVQQNSTLTYRLYDYLRKDKAGNARELHMEKAKDVANLSVVQKKEREEKQYQIFKTAEGELQKCILSFCKYFVAIEYLFAGKVEIESPKNTFACLTCVEGSGEMCGERFSQGDSFFVPAGSGKIQVSGAGRFLLAKVSKISKQDGKTITDDGDVLA